MKSNRWTQLRRLTRQLVVTIACTAMVACYSLQPIEGSPAQLQSGLRAGTLVKAGDRLQIRTANGTVYALKVLSIDQDGVHAKEHVVAIEDIVALQREEFSTGKTLLLAAGVVLVVVGVVAATADFGPSGTWGA